MKIIYTGQELPEEVTKTIFLAGPSPRGDQEVLWRKEALKYLEELGYDGHVFNPEYAPGVKGMDYDSQVSWERDALDRADAIVFWVARDIEDEVYGLTTNDEWGYYKESGRAFLGHPATADKVQYQSWWAETLGLPVKHNLKVILKDVLEFIGNGALRTGAKVRVPLLVWNTPSFQSWIASQEANQNELTDFKAKYVFTAPGRRHVLSLVHPTVSIAAEEGRLKANEMILFRSDISSVFLYHRDPKGLLKIVLVKEFRTPVRNTDSYVYELPGGSSRSPGKSSFQVAAEEVSEETGLHLDHSRLVELSSRQMGATLCGYHSQLFACELTAEEILALEQDDSVHGEEGTGERCTIHVWTPEEILARGDRVDWPQLGMIFEGVNYATRSL